MISTVPSTASAAARPGAVLSARLAELARPSVRTAPRPEQAKRLSLAPAGPGSLLRYGRRVLADVRFEGGTTDPAALRAAGAAVVNVSNAQRTVTAAVPPARLPAVAGVAGVAGVTEILTPEVSASGGSGGPTAAAIEECQGAATSEGDVQLRALEARQEFEVDGTGATVGILSDSFDTDSTATTDAAEDVASGDLPGPGNPCGRTESTSVLEDLSEGDGADEGRGMAQIVHDLAPGAKLAFATAFTGELAFAENIERLAKPVAEGGANAGIVVDDVFYYDEPMFQEGPVAVAADNVTAAGAAYLSAAGNDNLVDASGHDIASWEAPSFRDAPSCPSDIGASDERERCMDFDPGGGTDDTFGITVSGGATLTVDLQWAEPWYGVSTDVDVLLLDSSGSRIKEKGSYVGSFADNPGSGQKPVEVFQWTNGAGSARQVQLAVVRCFGGCNPGAASGTAPRLKVALLQNGGGVTVTEYPESAGGDVVGPTIFGHAGAESAIGTGAVPYDTTSEPEYYSSRGPVTHYFAPVDGASPAASLEPAQSLSKPDLVATDGGANTFFGFFESGAWRFYGTSAAAPHAAAVAALVKDADPGATPAEVRSALTSTAAAVGSHGPLAVGAGLVDAQAAVGGFVEEPPPDETPPETQIDSGPSGTTSDPTPTFGFSSTEEGSTFECRFDSEPFGPCSDGASHTPSSPLADGPHTFHARATDAADNTDESPASRSFTVDTEAPDPPTGLVTAPASPSNENQPLLSGDAEAGSTVRVYDDAACTDPALATGSAVQFESPGLALSVADDSTTGLWASATDDAENSSACSSSTATYSEDSQPPQTQIDSGPSGTTSDATPTFGFSSTEEGSTFECRFDSEPFGPCSDGASHTPSSPLADGPHTFHARATDAADNTDESPASRSFTVDTSVPPVSPTPVTPPPSTPDIAPPPLFLPDVAPPVAGLFAARKQGIGKPVTVRVRCDERCTVVVTGWVLASLRKNSAAAHASARKRARFRIRRVRRTIAAGQTVRLRLRPRTARAQRRLRRLARRGWRARARLAIRWTDRSGNSSSKRLTIQLRRRGHHLGSLGKLRERPGTL